MPSEKCESCSHRKFIMRYHVIFSTKYRRRVLGGIEDDALASMRRAEAMQGDWRIEPMEIDRSKPDHIRLLLRGTPDTRISEAVALLKQTSTYDMWHGHYGHMRSFYRLRPHHLWTRGCFCSTIGEVGEDTLRAYIEAQG